MTGEGLHQAAGHCCLDNAVHEHKVGLCHSLAEVRSKAAGLAGPQARHQEEEACISC